MWNSLIENVRSQKSFKLLLNLGLVTLAITMTLALLGCTWRDSVSIHHMAGSIALAKGDIAAAEAAFEKALEIQEAHLEDDATEPTAMTTRMRLAELYKRTDNYRKEHDLWKRAVDLEKKAHGEIHEHVVVTRHNLAVFYEKMGAHDDAERLLDANIGITKSHLPQFERLTSYSLGSFYLDREQFEKAKPFLERAVALSENPQTFEEKQDLYVALTSLGAMYLGIGKAGVAEGILWRALDLKVADDAERRASLRLLGKLYLEKGDYDRAESVMLESLGLSEFYWGSDKLNDDVPDDQINLSALYYRKHNYKEAQELLDRSLEIKLLIHGPYHTDVKNLLGRLAVGAAERKEYSSSLEYFGKAFAIENRRIADIFSFTSEAQKLDFIHTLSGSQNQFFSMFYQQLRHERQYYNRVFEYVLQRKGVVLDAQSQQEELLRHRLTGKSLELWEERLQLRGKQAHLLLQGSNKSHELGMVHQQLGEIEERLAAEGEMPYVRYNQQVLNQAYEHVESLNRPPTKEALERAWLRSKQTRLLLQGRGKMDPATTQELESVRQRLREIEEHPKGDKKRIREAETPAISRSSVTVGNIQNALPEGSALFEFVKFLNFDWTKRNLLFSPINEQYMAWVLTQKGGVNFIDLGDAEKIDIIVRRVIRDMHVIADLYDQGEIVGPDHPLMMRSRENLKELSAKLWTREVSELLEGVDKVLLSPDGELNRVPFAALLDGKGEYLLEKYEIAYLTSGADILNRSLPRTEPEQALFLVANPDYDYHLRAQDRENRPLQLAGRQKRFSALPHTAREADIIPSLVSGNEHQKQVLRRELATKAAVKAARHPRVLHLATHGFFFEREFSQVEGEQAGWASRYSDVLARAGLALAGANYSASGGVLTAFEVAGMDLSGTDLVVLSACDTGVGENETGEGVFGLRRAFTLAGAKNLVMSLWPVADDHTANEMKVFYTYRQTQSPAQALREAQKETIRELKNQYGVASPALWAPFILQGADALSQKKTMFEAK